jgi:hypothetical protein
MTQARLAPAALLNESYHDGIVILGHMVGDAPERIARFGAR